VHFLKGIEAGCWFALELLAIRKASLNWASRAYGHLGALSKLNELTKLHMGGSLVGPEGMAKIIEGVAAGCPNLVELYASGTGMGPAAGYVLVEALSRNGWPLLESLGVSCNPGLPSKVINMGLATAFQGGAGGRLDSLYISGCGMSEQGAHDLAQIMSDGVVTPGKDSLSLEADCDLKCKSVGGQRQCMNVLLGYKGEGIYPVVGVVDDADDWECDGRS